MNRIFQGKLERSFITAAFTVVDRAARSITYSSAGHPPAIIARADGTLDYLSTGGIMLGFVDTPYPETTTAFVPGDRLLLYTGRPDRGSGSRRRRRFSATTNCPAQLLAVPRFRLTRSPTRSSRA